MPVRNNASQKSIAFGEMYGKIKEEQKRIGLSTFAETVRYMCAKYLDDMRGADPPPAASPTE